MRDTIFVQDYKTTSSKQTLSFYVRKEIKMLVLFRTLFAGWMDRLESIYYRYYYERFIANVSSCFYKLCSSHSACYAWLCSFLKMKARFLRAIVPKFRLEVCKMKKSKIPKLCQDIGLDELFLEKIL